MGLRSLAVWLASTYLTKGFSMFFRLFALIAVVLSSLALSAQVIAHEGHDHGSVPASSAQTGAVKLEASSATFELLAVRQNGELTIWLDRFDTNEPVTDAVIEVETPVGPQMATPGADGKYRLASSSRSCAEITSSRSIPRCARFQHRDQPAQCRPRDEEWQTALVNANVRDGTAK